MKLILIPFITLVLSLSVFANEGLIAEPQDIRIELIDAAGCRNRIDLIVSGFRINSFAGVQHFREGHDFDRSINGSCGFGKTMPNLEDLAEIQSHYQVMIDSAIEQGKKIRLRPDSNAEYRLELID
jgi:hypothetical protein